MVFEKTYIPPARRQRVFPFAVRWGLLFLGCLGAVALMCLGMWALDALYHGPATLP